MRYKGKPCYTRSMLEGIIREKMNKTTPSNGKEPSMATELRSMSLSMRPPVYLSFHRSVEEHESHSSEYILRLRSRAHIERATEAKYKSCQKPRLRSQVCRSISDIEKGRPLERTLSILPCPLLRLSSRCSTFAIAEVPSTAADELTRTSSGMEGIVNPLEYRFDTEI
ncbi:hypothetical protein RND71_003586 [Anisodus tanguticus]|uniref:Uncharacterized protein n=1 Tax=Anisodus tanguticus TaxID=243964 RepID=A0AAE1VX58_9SOLA|nr:hypothetical protein RND71_003586 [Anisodus tanguticus]